MSIDFSTDDSTQCSISALDSRGNGLTATFTQVGDLFSHALYATRADGAQTLLLQSIEDSESSHWPSSPPLQEVHLEPQSDDQSVLLAVGRAGKSFWSLSAESRVNQSSSERLGQTEIVFDVACRLKVSPKWLGSIYEVSEGVSRIDRQEANGIELRHALSDTRLFIECDLSDGATDTISSETAITDASRIIIPAMRDNDIYPATFRWNYRMAL